MSSEEDDLEFTFFKKAEKVEKEKEMCPYCLKKYVSVKQHLNSCKEYKKKLAELEEKKEDKKEISSDKMDSIERKIQDLAQENLELRNMIKDAKNIMLTQESPAITSIYRELTIWDYEVFKNDVMDNFDLKQFDKVVKLPDDTEQNFFWSLKYLLSQNPEIKSDTDRHRATQFMNRQYRGDKKHYEFVIREAKKFFMALIEKYLLKGDSNGN